MAAKKAPEPGNPLTGTGPNTFSQVSSAPKAVRPFQGDPNEARRFRRLHNEAASTPGIVDAQVGYQKPAGMSHRNFAWLTGAHHMFPNEGAERGNPAINEPHEADSNVTVQRRAEDLSSREYGKAMDLVAHYGHGKRDPMGSLVDTQARNTNRVIGEHIQAGVEESVTQKFYGGRVGTRLPKGQEDLQQVHDAAVNQTPNRLAQSANDIAHHPDFVRDTPHLSHRERLHAAAGMVSSAAADTSPNNRWYEHGTGTYPNLDTADEVNKAVIERRSPDPAKILGYRANADKAYNRSADMIDSGDFTVSGFGNPVEAAKTVAFRGALAGKTSSDAYKVTDVHEASQAFPGLPTAKAKVYKKDNDKIIQYPDQPASRVKGATQSFVADPVTGKIKPEKGKSRPEQVLGESHSLVHAANDYATRKSLADAGLSRGVNYADTVHEQQAATWGSQQMRRGLVSHSEQYPVVRNWGAEGANLPNDPSDPLGSLARGETHSNLGPQFAVNPNTVAKEHTSRVKPYPIMPGD